jgi:hypothetical protein
MDWSDKGVLMDYRPCLEDIYNTFGGSHENTFVATRTVLRGRSVHIDDQSGETRVEYGEPINYNRELSILKKQEPKIDNNTKIEEQDNILEPLFAGHVQPIRYGVRSDLVKKIDILMNGFGHDDDVVNRARSGDAIHFWSVGSGEKWHGTFRSAVSQAMRDFAAVKGGNSTRQTEQLRGTIISRTWNITTAEIGARKKAGRNSVADEYVDALLSYKIVVVAQRDNWEGHYRLMEALAGGALVLTDPMHPLPCGIEDGLHVVVYNNMTQLKGYLKYYLEHDEERLAIAKNGHKTAMANHRSWEIMERMVFGDWTKHYCSDKKT